MHHEDIQRNSKHAFFDDMFLNQVYIVEYILVGKPK